MNAARSAWLRFETVHAVIYFAPESRAAAKRAGLRGFWMGYFAFRAAPLGAVDPEVVTEAFAGFAPRLVERAIPDAWSYAAPADLLIAHEDAAVAALARVAPAGTTPAPADLARLDAVARRAIGERRRAPLYAANAALAAPDAPVPRLWQTCTTMREHRGDAHVDALRRAGLDGCAPHVLFAAAEDVPVEVLRDNRGWTVAEWVDATDRLVARGLLARDGTVTDRGREVRAEVEGATDAATHALLGSDADWAVTVLDPIARAVGASGTIPYPNPMGLAPLR